MCSPLCKLCLFVLFFLCLPQIITSKNYLEFRIFCLASALFPCSCLVVNPFHPKKSLNLQGQPLKSLRIITEMNSTSVCLSMGRGSRETGGTARILAEGTKFFANSSSRSSDIRSRPWSCTVGDQLGKVSFLSKLTQQDSC